MVKDLTFSPMDRKYDALHGEDVQVKKPKDSSKRKKKRDSLSTIGVATEMQEDPADTSELIKNLETLASEDVKVEKVQDPSFSSKKKKSHDSLGAEDAVRKGRDPIHLSKRKKKHDSMSSKDGDTEKDLTFFAERKKQHRGSVIVDGMKKIENNTDGSSQKNKKHDVVASTDIGANTEKDSTHLSERRKHDALVKEDIGNDVMNDSRCSVKRMKKHDAPVDKHVMAEAVTEPTISSVRKGNQDLVVKDVKETTIKSTSFDERKKGAEVVSEDIGRKMLNDSTCTFEKEKKHDTLVDENVDKTTVKDLNCSSEGKKKYDAVVNDDAEEELVKDPTCSLKRKKASDALIDKYICNKMEVDMGDAGSNVMQDPVCTCKKKKKHRNLVDKDVIVESVKDKCSSERKQGPLVYEDGLTPNVTNKTRSSKLKKNEVKLCELYERNPEHMGDESVNATKDIMECNQAVLHSFEKNSTRCDNKLPVKHEGMKSFEKLNSSSIDLRSLDTEKIETRKQKLRERKRHKKRRENHDHKSTSEPLTMPIGSAHSQSGNPELATSEFQLVASAADAMSTKTCTAPKCAETLSARKETKRQEVNECASSCVVNGSTPMEIDRVNDQSASILQIASEQQQSSLLTINDNQEYLPMLSPKSVIVPRKKLLVLDLNGLLADIKHPRAVRKRPFCDSFLEFCFQNFEIGVWSSRRKCNVDHAVRILLGHLRYKLLFCWDLSHCTNTGFKTIEFRGKPLVLKQLKKIWDKCIDSLPWEKGYFSPSNTLLIDDSPYKALCNPLHTGIFPYPYDSRNHEDSSLGPGGDLRCYLEGLAASTDVESYVREHEFGQPPITEENPMWNFYLQVIDKVQGI